MMEVPNSIYKVALRKSESSHAYRSSYHVTGNTGKCYNHKDIISKIQCKENPIGQHNFFILFFFSQIIDGRIQRLENNQDTYESSCKLALIPVHANCRGKVIKKSRKHEHWIFDDKELLFQVDADIVVIF